MIELNRRRCTVPPHAHPLVRALFGRMAEHGVTYDQLAARSGQKRSCVKAWRRTNSPNATSIQAALNAVGLQALPIPNLGILPEDLAAELKMIGQRHGVPVPLAEMIIVAAVRRAPTERTEKAQA